MVIRLSKKRYCEIDSQYELQGRRGNNGEIKCIRGLLDVKNKSPGKYFDESLQAKQHHERNVAEEGTNYNNIISLIFPVVYSFHIISRYD